MQLRTVNGWCMSKWNHTKPDNEHLMADLYPQWPAGTVSSGRRQQSGWQQPVQVLHPPAAQGCRARTWIFIHGWKECFRTFSHGWRESTWTFMAGTSVPEHLHVVRGSVPEYLHMVAGSVPEYLHMVGLGGSVPEHLHMVGKSVT